jgi:hypothetical protein
MKVISQLSKRASTRLSRNRSKSKEEDKSGRNGELG